MNRIFVLFNFLFVSLVLTAGNNSDSILSKILIKDNLDTMLFTDFVKKIEKTYPVKFYFHQRWMSSLRVTQTDYPCLLTDLLDKTFQDINFYYIIDKTNILISPGEQIVSNLPTTFFKIDTIQNDKLNDSIVEKLIFFKSQVDFPTLSNNIIQFGKRTDLSSPKNVILSGIVRDENSEPIPGAKVTVINTGKCVITDAFGHYSVDIQSGSADILFSSFGKKNVVISVLAFTDGILNSNLSENQILLKEVVVNGDRGNRVKNVSLGVQKLNIDEIKLLPKMLGETDIVKSALFLPGVQTVGEGASGFNVRGGGSDQNLILYDDAPVFNSSHFFGFFSSFNSEAVKDFELYKCGIPARFGGRTSSVFDITARQGNLKKLGLSGGVSPVAGKLTLEGPLIKDKLSFIMGMRTTYSNWVIKKIDRPELKNSVASFYDVSLKLLYDIDKNNTLSLTAYKSNDYFKLHSDTAYKYDNQLIRMYYKHIFNHKLYGRIALIESNYQYDINSDKKQDISFSLKYNIDYKSIKSDFVLTPNEKVKFNFGTEIIRYGISPGEFRPLSVTSDIKSQSLALDKGLESSFFLHNDYEVSSRLAISAGVRYVQFCSLGPSKLYVYNSSVPKSIDSRIDSVFFNNNKIAKFYGGPELRLSFRYLLSDAKSLKFSYNRIHQFIHILSNSAAISPTDIWKLSDNNIKPLIGDQYSLGYFQNFMSGEIEGSTEVYYKKSTNNLDYRGGTQLLMNKDLDIGLLSGIGRAYGIELMIKKKNGILNGWLTYSYSRAFLKMNSEFAVDRINNGQYYPADYDKPHSLNLVVNYKYTRRITLANTFSYSTGRPISYPVSKYVFRGIEAMNYSNRNEYRLPDYMRWDVSLNVDENFNTKKILASSWSIGVYNLLGRDNVYSVFFKSTYRGVKAYKLSVFAQPIVNLTCNFKF